MYYATKVVVFLLEPSLVYSIQSLKQSSKTQFIFLRKYLGSIKSKIKYGLDMVTIIEIQ